MLGAFYIKYIPRTAIKGQVLANFVMEFTENIRESRRLELSILVVSTPSSLPWEVYTDGAANQRGSRVGIELMMLEKLIIEKSLWLGFPATNNEAEYKALLAGIEMVEKLGGECPHLYSDSHLVVGHVNGEFEAWDHRM